MSDSNGSSPEIQFDVEERLELDMSKERSFCVDGRGGKVYASLDEDLQPNTSVEFYDTNGDVEDRVEVDRVFLPGDEVAKSCIEAALEKLEAEAQAAGEN
jgi:hypothetical protein